MYNRNILIADDEDSFLNVYKNILSRKGTEEDNFIIKTFYNGKKLLTYFKNEYDTGNKIPLAILDIKMPVMDGMETASEIRKIDPDVFILFVTAYSDISINRLRENLKKDIYYINKPFDKENLFYLVDTLVKNWNRNDDLEIRVKERTAELLIIKDALQESLEKYRVLFESFPLGITITDNKGNILECNKAWEIIYGIDCKEHIGRSIYGKEWKIIRPDGSPMTTGEYAGVRALRENQIVRQIEAGVVKDNNEITWISITAAPIPLKNYGVAITCEDITKKMALQAEALRMNRLASIGELAAGVAHEINNPINSIINCAEILINKRDRAGVKKISAMIIEEGERIAHIVRSLLSFSRPQDEEKIPVKINEILYNTLTLIKASISKDDIKLIIDIPEDLPPVNVRPRQIEQVFLNLLNNARYALNKKYPFHDENKILEITGKKITVHDKKYISIIFHDRGTGIPVTLFNNLASPFFTTKPAGEGTGLGLSISHNIISSYGGRLIFDSVEGDFTKVTIEMPEGESHDVR
jgi:PAS domain S-box-containing protein